MTKTQRAVTERALRKIQKCSGDCKYCIHCQVPCVTSESGGFYAFLCGIADKAGYILYSNTIKDLKATTIECLKFELA